MNQHFKGPVYTS